MFNRSMEVSEIGFITLQRVWKLLINFASSAIHTFFFAKQKRARIKTSIKSWARCDEPQLVLTQSKNVCFFKGCSRRRRSSIWSMVERGGRHRVVWLMDLSSLWMQKREAKRKEREKKSITIQSVLGNCPVFFFIQLNFLRCCRHRRSSLMSSCLVQCVCWCHKKSSIDFSKYRRVKHPWRWNLNLISIHSHENRWARTFSSSYKYSLRVSRLNPNPAIVDIS